jgi:hypothetical protein
VYGSYFWHRSEGEGNSVAYGCGEHIFALLMCGHTLKNVTIASFFLNNAFYVILDV